MAELTSVGTKKNFNSHCPGGNDPHGRMGLLAHATAGGLARGMACAPVH